MKEFSDSCATVEEAAQTIGVAPSRIAKTLTLRKEDWCMMLVMAGNAGIGQRIYLRYS
ncbi:MULTISPECIES: YbaK/EbsC family protein [Clostridia]|uniref:YbaK/EbsC family protein n=1 Tax=Clostridia TaxID=186801 RepID=UPI0034600C08